MDGSGPRDLRQRPGDWGSHPSGEQVASLRARAHPQTLVHLSPILPALTLARNTGTLLKKTRVLSMGPLFLVRT